MKKDNGSHEQQSSGSTPRAHPSVRTYRQLKRQLHKDLLAQHPEWIDADGNCPIGDDYERRLAQLISIFKFRSRTIGSKNKSQRKKRNET